MLHHLVLWVVMELLEFTQEENRGLLVVYVQDFSRMLIVIPIKDEYAQKLIFLHGLKPWVQKIVYQKIDILEMCQGLMKMECKEDEALSHPKGETRSRVIQKNQADPSSVNKIHNKQKWGQGKPRPQNDKEKLASKKLSIKKAKQDLSKVKYFNCDNNGHLAKDYTKPLRISECIA
jgi:hypothetical protein